MKIKEYRIPLPLTLDEYRLGQQWTENELLKETLQTCSTLVTIEENLSEQKRLEIIEEKLPNYLKSQITSSTNLICKKYHIKDQKPKILDFFFLNSTNDLILDEYSFNNWPYTLTIIENLHHSLRLIIQSYYQNISLDLLNSSTESPFYFLLNHEQKTYLKDFEILNLTERFNEKKDYRIDEDPTRNISIKRPHLLPLEFNTKWYETYSKTQSFLCVYKLIELSLFNEKSFLIKATNKILWSSILKTQKLMYLRFHQKMLCNIDQWIDKTIEELLCEEKRLFQQEN